jgi:hypothetical protein
MEDDVDVGETVASKLEPPRHEQQCQATFRARHHRHANADIFDMITPTTRSDGVQRAVDRLKTLHDDDRGLLQVILCGRRAIPALRNLLFERDPSGLFQVRCRAVQALSCLGAREVLADFLSSHAEAADPVERMGDDAVVNAAALALVPSHDEETFRLLEGLAKMRLRPGVIKALATFRRCDTIPLLISALKDDDSRRPAEAALKQFGIAARQALLVAAAKTSDDGESRLRAVRSILGLLISIGIPPGTWPALRHLMQHPDAKVMILACKICHAHAEASETRTAIERLISLLPDVNWMLGEEITDCLVDHHHMARELIGALLACRELRDGNHGETARFKGRLGSNRNASRWSATSLVIKCPIAVPLNCLWPRHRANNQNMTEMEFLQNCPWS